MWVRYNHRWAHGLGEKDHYIEIPDDETLIEYGYDNEKLDDRIGQYIREETSIMKDNEWSDKYRGIEFDPIDFPPVSHVLEKIKSHASHLEWHEEQLIRFRKMLDELGYINKEDFNV